MKVSKEARVAIAVIVAVLVFAGIWQALTTDGDDDDTDRSTTPPVSASSTVQVLLEVEGTATTASITVNTPDGIEQYNAEVPLVATDGNPGVVLTYPRGAFVSISAQKGGNGTGTISCRITSGGDVISENTSSASYGIASCDGTAG